MLRLFFVFIIGLSCLTLGACSSESAASKDVDYDATKKMVVDILQTDDGKKALQKILKDEKMKQSLVIDADVVQSSINNVLSSEKGQEMWIKLFDNPKFVETYAKSMAEQHKKLIKSLMNDAEYQKQMLGLLQNPEITEQMLEVMKSQKFNAHLEKTILQTLESPLFQAKIQDTLLKAASEQQKGDSKSQSDGKEKSKGKGSSGDSSSGGGGGGASE
ncbi:spore gernimation protein GerD [Virgibacillus phasianinus]|uniref:Spore gernimation protein GerD n=1 Tax=Virgibacillus phasianinus TaxID=2017483 RepID=A0A220U0I4_9BACI|nr:spore germination lipoprotein GerD [Virgibacillus phasianinus]ASK61580.1 spore gernimation protein GerD [Virgibacillus phasianinus]